VASCFVFVINLMEVSSSLVSISMPSNQPHLHPHLHAANLHCFTPLLDHLTQSC
jgi:hypothetical protein